MEVFQINENVYDEVIKAVKKLKEENPNMNARQMINKIDMMGIKNSKIRITTDDIREYIKLGIKREDIEEIEQNNNRAEMIRTLKAEIDTSVAIKQAEEKQAEAEKKKTMGFHSRHR